MPCVTLKNAATGAERVLSVPMGQSFRHMQGEVLVKVEPHCDAIINEIARVSSTPNLDVPSAFAQLRDELDREIGSGGGDWIKAFVRPFATMLGKKSCTKCEARRLAVNAYAQLKAKYDQPRAIQMIKDLWATSAEDPEGTLRKLSEYLDGKY